MRLAAGRSGGKPFDQDRGKREPERADVVGADAAAAAHDLGAARDPPGGRLGKALGRPLGIEAPGALGHVRLPGVRIAPEGKARRARHLAQAIGDRARRHAVHEDRVGLEGLHRGHRVGQELAVPDLARALADEADQDRNAGGLRPAKRRLGLRRVVHGLDQDQIHALARQPDRLLGVLPLRHRRLGRQVGTVAVLEGRQGAGHQNIAGAARAHGCLARETHRKLHQPLRLAGASRLGQGPRRRAERVRRDDVGPRGHVLLVDRADGVGRVEERLRAPERKRRRNPAARELRAHGAVQHDQLPAVQAALQGIVDHSAADASSSVLSPWNCISSSMTARRRFRIEVMEV